MKRAVLIIGFIIWTIICIYGTYISTIKSAEMAVLEEGYTITYHNTNQTYIYN